MALMDYLGSDAPPCGGDRRAVSSAGKSGRCVGVLRMHAFRIMAASLDHRMPKMSNVQHWCVQLSRGASDLSVSTPPPGRRQPLL